ncbi:alpha/beta fold hydrolase [Microbacterium sp. zg-YB36]|uniref:alpha/beta hydrolase n=1 Tax=Microbacterium sp. zg-YB36 TaxID=2969407 RepID=UPI00214C0750|nr:alpha/beta fold hydrolase [Microbacterium sp. zg-YB36]MDL5352678.1 alpha/beta hydrolase-fold protein [Microbacterium sp. zg-YB36]
MVAIPLIDPVPVRWSTPPAERGGRPLLVLLHGYGSDENDLFALTPQLPEEYVVAAVRAPLSPPFPTPGYCWYPIEGLEDRRPDDVTTAASRVVQWVDAASDAASIGLLGFSQGGAVALQALRLRPELFAFAVNLSGYVTPGELPGDERLAERRPPVFWGRGTRDDVIPTELVDHTVQWLPDHVDLSGRVYTGLTHSVSQQELDDIAVFLRKRLDDPTPV